MFCVPWSLNRDILIRRRSQDIYAVLRNKAQKTVAHISDGMVSLRWSTSAPGSTSASSPSVHDVFICEWMCEWLFVFGGLHVILLPALCNHLQLSLFQS